MMEKRELPMMKDKLARKAARNDGRFLPKK
jgi:hypothetical protein